MKLLDFLAKWVVRHDVLHAAEDTKDDKTVEDLSKRVDEQSKRVDRAIRRLQAEIKLSREARGQ